jgi:CRISPR/Cas system CMR-associated protein Cmr5 small subunit
MREPVDQRRASAAAYRVSDWRQKFADSKNRKAFWRGYCGTVDRLPGDIRYAGLLRALARVLQDSQKDEDEALGRRAVLTDLVYRFDQFQGIVPNSLGDINDRQNFLSKGQELIETLIDTDARKVQLLQHESGEFLAWLKLLSAPHKPKPRTSAQDEAEAEDASETEVQEKEP